MTRSVVKPENPLANKIFDSFNTLLSNRFVCSLFPLLFYLSIYLFVHIGLVRNSSLPTHITYLSSLACFVCFAFLVLATQTPV